MSQIEEHRIISLAPHITEVLFAIGAGDQIVGAVSYSDYPEAARDIPRIGGYDKINYEAILATEPTLIIGWDSGRLAMLLAVLEARCNVTLAGRDVYLSVAGGYRITEPAGDLAAAAALLSSMSDTAPPERSIFFGEVALSGTLRPVARMEQRLKEAKRLGFQRAFVPDGVSSAVEGLTITPIKRLSDLVDFLAPEAIADA